MKKICNVTPDTFTCRMCVDTQQSCGIVEDCSKCSLTTKEYEILDFSSNIFGTYALLQDKGEIKKVSIDRVKNIREA